MHIFTRHCSVLHCSFQVADIAKITPQLLYINLHFCTHGIPPIEWWGLGNLDNRHYWSISRPRSLARQPVWEPAKHCCLAAAKAVFSKWAQWLIHKYKSIPDELLPTGTTPPTDMTASKSFDPPHRQRGRECRWHSESAVDSVQPSEWLDQMVP